MNRILSSALAVLAGVFLALTADCEKAAAQEPESPLEVKANLDLPIDAGGESEEEAASPETVIFYGEMYEGLAFVFCCQKQEACDGGDTFRRIRKELLRTLSGLSERAEFGIVFFDERVRTFPSRGRLVEARDESKKSASDWAMSQSAGFNSCTKAGLLESLFMAARSSARQKVIILVSDGLSICAGSDAKTYERQTLAEVRGRNTERVAIHTVGVGVAHPVNEPFLKRLAAENQGTYRRAPK